MHWIGVIIYEYIFAEDKKSGTFQKKNYTALQRIVHHDIIQNSMSVLKSNNNKIEGIRWKISEERIK